jgi:(1->4)-alpha-D-glucan 1-alpha-D-glucosylmutase
MVGDLAPDRPGPRGMTKPAAPGATYRIQLNRDFRLTDAGAIVPYLAALGITHVYASPLLKARAGSPHGYDIVDHDQLNPEIGSDADLDRFVAKLRRHGMGLILDIVPNHMGVGGDDNAWWLDVLENGESSPYAEYFDIDWHPINPALQNKLLVPILGDHYGQVLEAGEFRLELEPASGTLGVRYFSHWLPLDPRSYPVVLQPMLAALAAAHERGALADLEALIADCRALPRRTELSKRRRRQRREGIATCKARLAELCRTHELIRKRLQKSLSTLGGQPGEPASFDGLHRLLEAQAYRLAYWVVAADEINYRRFFDINDLAGLCMDKPAVFEATHHLIARLIKEARVDGLRIDHPDGLSDPHGYYVALAELVRRSGRGGNERDEFPILVEKILASYERLPDDWPVTGTTGYEAAFHLNGLFVRPDSERPFTELFRRLSSQAEQFDELLYRCKKLVIRRALASELTTLAHLATDIARLRRSTRDFTYHGLREAIAEVAACFPVYRTYLTRERAAPDDRRYIAWAAAVARKRNPSATSQLFDFLERLLGLEALEEYSSRGRRLIVQFTQRFQQYSAPVMAKGLEDTAMYRYHRLISLNDVGFDPGSFGISPAAFHRSNQLRLQNWPHCMIGTSTHDSKRGEDVRARINVLSEIPSEWRGRVNRWRRLNRSKKRIVDDALAPSESDEYLLYQTLVGIWPMGIIDEPKLADLRDRLETFMIKSIREAKAHTSWAHSNEDYEDAVVHFVRALADDPERNPFLVDFINFQGGIARYGLLNGVAHTLLKLTVPGVPDVYQGNEVWAFNLVDPDNRRPVDYARAAAALAELETRASREPDRSSLLQDVLERPEDGRAKLYVTWRTLNLRRRRAALFRDGDYVPLMATGRLADHVCGFARRYGDEEALVVTPRWLASLRDDPATRWPDGDRWRDTWIALPSDSRDASWTDALSGAQIRPLMIEGEPRLEAGSLLRRFPGALLVRD